MQGVCLRNGERGRMPPGDPPVATIPQFAGVPLQVPKTYVNPKYHKVYPKQPRTQGGSAAQTQHGGIPVSPGDQNPYYNTPTETQTLGGTLTHHNQYAGGSDYHQNPTQSPFRPQGHAGYPTQNQTPGGIWANPMQHAGPSTSSQNLNSFYNAQVHPSYPTQPQASGSGWNHTQPTGTSIFSQYPNSFNNGQNQAPKLTQRGRSGSQSQSAGKPAHRRYIRSLSSHP